MLKGKMELRLGTEQWVCGPGDVMVNPGGPEEHEAWFHKDTSGLNRTALIRIFDTNFGNGSHFLIWQIALLKSFLGDGRKYSGTPTRVARGDGGADNDYCCHGGWKA